MTTEQTLEKSRSALLADLNRGGMGLMKKWVNRLIKEVREEHAKRGSKIRILDIGCGTSPYLQGIKGEDLDLHFWDMEEQAKLNKGLSYNPHEYGTFEKVKFPDDAPKALELLRKHYNEDLNAGEPLFHIILCSATLHELLQQWPLWTLIGGSGSDSERDFSKWLFDQFKERGLVGANSLILLGELYHRNFWSRDTLEEAQKVQKRICGHADPPAAFPDPSSIVQGALETGKYTFECFDEDFSVPEDHEIFKEPELKEGEVKSHFRNRRFASLVFQFSPTRNNAHKRRSFGELISHSVGSDVPLSDGLKAFDKALSNWVGGSVTDGEIRAKYNELFVGDRYSGSKVFPALASACAYLTSNFFEYMKAEPPKRQTFWFSVNSLIIHGGRYLPQSENEKDLSFSTNPHKKDLVEKPEDNDWATIGYNHLLSVLKKKEIFGGIPLLLENALAPSLYRWFTDPQGPPDRELPKSVTITYAEWNRKQQAKEAMHAAETLDASGLVNWSETTKVLCDKHLLALIPFDDKDDEFKIGAYVNKLTQYGYCGDPTRKDDSGIAARVMESIASVLLDFQFLGRIVNPHDKEMEQGEVMREPRTVLDEFEHRWLTDNNKVRFFNNEQELRELAAKKEASLMLPLPYKKPIESACKAARKLLANESGAIFPRVWTTLSPSQEGHDAPGNVMFFSDQLHGAMLLDLMTVKMQKTFQAIRAIELKWKKAQEVATEARTQELEKSAKAIAGFTHQVGHVLEAKSGLSPLRDFADWLSARSRASEMGLISAEDFQFRAAQTRYACILPKVFAYTMEQPDPAEQNKRIWGKAKDLKEIIEGVWSQLLLPCARAAASVNRNFGTFGLEPKLVWGLNCAKAMVPSNDLVEAILFEIFWNACRHGNYKNTPSKVAEIEITICPFGVAAVKLVVKNPATDYAKRKEDCCQHLRAFVGTLHSWNHAARANQFSISFPSNSQGKWITELVLPIQSQGPGGAYDDL